MLFDACVQETNWLKGGEFMVWDGITYQERTDLTIIEGNLNAKRYRNEILAPLVLPFVFQQNNARCHIKHILMSFRRIITFECCRGQ